MATAIVFCPNQHENLAGLSHCRVCGLPLLDMSTWFESLAEAHVSRAEMGRPQPRAVLIGLGTTGAATTDLASAAHVEPTPDYTYVAIDTKGLDSESQARRILRLTLGGSTPNAGTFCGIGQGLVKDDPYLTPLLRKAGFGAVSSGQIVILIAAIGGGIGSAPWVIVKKCRQLNSECHSVAVVIVPGCDESFHNKLNAYYGLSRLLEGDGCPVDMVVAMHYDRLRRISGVGASGEELRGEGLLAAFSDLLLKNLSSQSISEIVRINRSMGISVVVPCLALGRSLEIFGNLGNILESAMSFPTNNVAREAVLVCHLLLRVPASIAAGFSEEVGHEELRDLVRKHLPCVRSTSVSITYGAEQHDRVDACLLLGGDSCRTALFADGSVTDFEEELKERVTWETYGLTAEGVHRAVSTLTEYDRALERAGVERRRQGVRKGRNRATATNERPGEQERVAGTSTEKDNTRTNAHRFLGRKGTTVNPDLSTPAKNSDTEPAAAASGTVRRKTAGLAHVPHVRQR